MAYMSQTKKKELAPRIKDILKRYGLKGSIAVNNHSTLVINIKSGPIDFFTNYRNTLANQHRGWDNDTWWIKHPESRYHDVNVYHYQNQYTGVALAFLDELLLVANDGNHDNSDIMTDYFDVGWYVDVNIGKWDKPYELTGEPEAKTERLLELEAQHLEKEAA